jgi:TPR repeat protein
MMRRKKLLRNWTLRQLANKRSSCFGALFAVLLASPASAQGEHRVALVIGNSAYEHAPPLKNAAHDAAKVATVLRSLDFDVKILTDIDKIAMEQALRRFAVDLAGADVALFYYSGHAVQVGDRNYLIPVSAAIDGPRNVTLDTVALQDVNTVMRSAGSHIQLLFLDACRDNPFETSLSAAEGMSATRGLARVQTPRGSLIAYSTSPGQTALDGSGLLSPYTDAFTRHAATAKLEIRQVLSRVRADVTAATNQRQMPWDSSSLVTDFYLVPPRPPPEFEHVVRINAPARQGPQPLHLVAPRQPEGGAVSITISRPPAAGRLLNGSTDVLAGDKLTPDDFGQLAYEARTTTESDGFGFEVEDAWGNTASGLVLIARQQAADVAAAPAPRPLANVQASAVSLLGLGPNLIFRHALDLPADAKRRRVKLASNLPFGQLTLEGRVIEPGRTVEVADLSKLAFAPPAGFEGRHLDAIFQPEENATGGIQVGIDVELTDCDRLAGDRLDLQGVAEGVITGQIDTAIALPACESAVKARPTVARFAYQLSRVYAALGRNAESADLVRRAADLGHIRALYALGYRAEYIPPVDQFAGKGYLERAAALGDIFAAHELGNLYYKGRGVTQDFAKARALFETAARMGHTYSMNALGRMYQRGEGAPVDRAMTRRYWSESAARGDMYGMDNLGYVYLDGIDVAKNPSKALDHFKKAAELGHPSAPNDIGRMYVLGTGVPVDYAEARRWYLIGADRGDAWAAYNLAELDRLGHGSSPDRVAAGYNYARAAAAQNNGNVAELSYKQLTALDRGSKRLVLARLMADVDPSLKISDDTALVTQAQGLVASKMIKPADASLDSLIVAVAQVLWIARTKRTDLF